MPALLTFHELWHIQDAGREDPKSILHWSTFLEISSTPLEWVEVRSADIVVDVVLRLVKPSGAVAIKTSVPDVISS